MAHGIEINGDLAAFAASRKPAWHQLGTVVAWPRMAARVGPVRSIVSSTG